MQGTPIQGTPLEGKPLRARRARRSCSECGSRAHDVRTCPKAKQAARVVRTVNGAAVRASSNGQALAALLTRDERAELGAVVSVCDALKTLPAQRREAVFRAALALLELAPR